MVWHQLRAVPAFRAGVDARDRAGTILVRSANTGISGVVDPYGRVIARTELFVPATLAAEVRLLEPWTLYARIGDAFAYACVTLTVLALVASLRAQPYRLRASDLPATFWKKELSLVAITREDQMRRYQDLVKRSSDLRSYL